MDNPGVRRSSGFRNTCSVCWTRPRFTVCRCPILWNSSCTVVELIEANEVAPCYIRPIAFRGYGEMGVNPKHSPVEVYMANFPWGKYVAGDAADVCVSLWNRSAPNTTPSLAKAGGNYLNSQLTPHGSGRQRLCRGHCPGCERIPVGRLGRKSVYRSQWRADTTPLVNSVLSGITRDSVLTLARRFRHPLWLSRPCRASCSILRMSFLHRYSGGGYSDSQCGTGSRWRMAKLVRSRSSLLTSSLALPTGCGRIATDG